MSLKCDNSFTNPGLNDDSEEEDQQNAPKEKGAEAPSHDSENSEDNNND